MVGPDKTKSLTHHQVLKACLLPGLIIFAIVKDKGACESLKNFKVFYTTPRTLVISTSIVFIKHQVQKFIIINDIYLSGKF